MLTKERACYAWNMGMAVNSCSNTAAFRREKLPEIARNLGKGIKEFKKASKDISSEIDFSEDKQECNDKTEDGLSGNAKK